ncbi:hypothetical protein Tco_0707130 [Tanacetum coccineum]|uniref:Uncharacterized protein n=1 Tax=Tanacetum coccineum TaxID=301880 RepID=A0ABQ4Y9D7_9ASTR
MFVEFVIQNQLFSYSLEDFAQILDVPCEGTCVFTDRWRLNELAYGQVHRIRHEEEIDVHDYQILTHEIIPTLKPLEEIIRENVFCLGGNRDYVLACLCFMLYCVVHSERFNLAYYMAKQMEWLIKQARLILPYGMLLTRLFTFIMNEYPELNNESYVLYDRVTTPLAAQLEQKPRRDRGMRRGCHSTSSSSAFDQPSLSHLNDDDDNGNDKRTSRIATKRSRIQTLNSQESGSGDEVDILSKVPNEQVHIEDSDGVDDANQDLDAHDDDDDDATESDDDDEEQEEDDDEDEEDISDQLVRTSLDYQASDESEKQKDDDRVKDSEEDKEGDETNVNLEGGDVDMTEADTTKDTEDAHVTLTAATPFVQRTKFNRVMILMKEAVDVAIQLKSNKLREEAQAENQEFLNSLDSNMQKIIKDQVKTQTSKIKSKVEKTRDDKDKDEEPSAGSNRGTKRWRSGKEAESSKEPTRKESRTTSSSKGASRSQPTDLNETTHLEFITCDMKTILQEVHDETQWNPPTSLTLGIVNRHLTKTVSNYPPQHWITDLA